VRGFYTVGHVNSNPSTHLSTETDPSLRAHPTISFWQGVAERFLYTSTILLGKPEGIAVWLAFKAIMRWKTTEDTRHIPGGAIYLIGTALSLVLGVVGGLIAVWKFEL
jgi:hypothetical protein